jgi:uncharacterized phage protein gp47/JayE
MAWHTRSLADISQTVRGAFRQYLPGSDAGLKNSFVTICGKVLSLLVFELELRVAAILPQLFMASATGRFLERHCADFGITRKPAAAATGSVTGTAAASETVAAGVRFIVWNVPYVSTAAATANGAGAITLPVQAEISGVVTNRLPGDVLALADPVLHPTLGATWTVTSSGLGGGADLETDAGLRARGLQRKRNPPQGGALSDYERIVLAVPGVLKAWAFRVPNSPGAVVVHFLFEGRTNSIPESGDVTAVQAAIDAARLIRVDAGEATAPVAQAVNVTINGLSNDTAEIRALIEANLRAMFTARCRPGITGNTFTLSRSWIAETISQTVGEDRHVLAAPSADITLTGGAFPVLGTMTYGA